MSRACFATGSGYMKKHCTRNSAPRLTLCRLIACRVAAMKKIFLVALFVIGCGGSKKQPETTTGGGGGGTGGSGGGGAPTEGVPCEKEIALVCPDGQIDGCLKTPVEGTTHACVAK